MNFQNFVLLMIFLVVIEGVIVIVMGHVINAPYFNSTKNLGEAMANLKRDRPATSRIIGICYALMLVEFLVVVAIGIRAK